LEVCLKKPFRNLCSRICPQDLPWAILGGSLFDAPANQIDSLFAWRQLLRLVAAGYLPLIAYFVIVYISRRRFAQGLG
jgi:hypothetical protein